MARLRSGSRTMGGPMTFVVSIATRVAGDLVLPPDRYAGTVEWEERLGRSGFERGRKRYKIRIEAEELERWGAQAMQGQPFALIDVTAEVAAGEIGLL